MDVAGEIRRIAFGPIVEAGMIVRIGRDHLLDHEEREEAEVPVPAPERAARPVLELAGEEAAAQRGVHDGVGLLLDELVEVPEALIFDDRRRSAVDRQRFLARALVRDSAAVDGPRRERPAILDPHAQLP
jgi:hypothetical protein